MKWQDASKLLVGGTVTVIALLSVLLQLNGMTYTHSGDTECETIDGIYQCAAFINISSPYWNIGFENTRMNQYIYLPNDLNDFEGKLTKYKVSDLNFTPTLYKKARYGHKLWVNLNNIDNVIYTNPNVTAYLQVPTYGNKWRNIKEGDMIKNKNVTNRLRLVAYPDNHFSNIKWSFILGEIDIDPIFIGTTLDYDVSKLTVEGKEARKITLNNLDKDYDLSELAISESKTESNYLSILVEKHYGDVDANLYQKVYYEKEYNRTIEENCTEVELDSKILLDSKINESETTKTVCDYKNITERKSGYRFDKINSKDYTLKNEDAIYEIVEKPTKIELIPNVGWGYSIYTEPQILGTTIEGATWWNQSFGKRKNITISSETGAGTNYQVKLIVAYNESFNGDYHLEGNGNANFSDSRFTDNDEETLLPYWIESKTDGQNMTVWVNVSDDLSSDDVSIFHYYGNSEATDASSGDDTFILFDDFNGVSLDTDKWNIGASDGTISFDNSILKLQGNAGSYRYYITSKTAYSNAYAFRFRALVETTAASAQITQIGLYNFISNAQAQIKSYSGTPLASTFDGLGNKDERVISTDYFDTWQTYDIMKTDTVAKYYSDGNIIIDDGDNNPDGGSQNILLYCRDSEYDLYSDWVVIRKFVATEPSFSSAGAEESADSTAPTVTISTESQSTNDNTPSIIFTATDAVDSVLDCTAYFNATTTTQNSSTANNTATTLTATTLTDANYTNVYVNCTDDNSNTGQSNSIWLKIDTIKPTITIDSPTNTTYDTTSIDLNWSADETLDWSAYSLNGGANTSFADEGTYTTEHFDTAASGNGNIGGITNNGIYFWIADWNDAEVYKYYLNGTYISSWDTAVSGNTDPYGISTDGTYIWIVDNGGAEVYKYYLNGTYISSWDTAVSGNGEPSGITIENSYIWIVDAPDKYIYKYYMNSTYTGTYLDIDIGATIYHGIDSDGIYFWVTEDLYDKVHKFYMNSSYVSSFDVGEPSGITIENSYIWIADWRSNEVYKYYVGNFKNDINTTITAQEGSNNVIVYANDTVGNMNSTQVYFTVTTDTCTYSGSGNWVINCADNCELISTNLNENEVRASGSGTVHNWNNVYNYSKRILSGGCYAYSG